tara:strand:+ start:2578 stop:2790 length:213 start_codon:yes stop_codon:yes gene_type:complete
MHADFFCGGRGRVDGVLGGVLFLQGLRLGCDRNRMANFSEVSDVVQEKYILYQVTDFSQSGIRFLLQPTT